MNLEENMFVLQRFDHSYDLLCYLVLVNCFMFKQKVRKVLKLTKKTIIKIVFD